MVTRRAFCFGGAPRLLNLQEIRCFIEKVPTKKLRPVSVGDVGGVGDKAVAAVTPDDRGEGHGVERPVRRGIAGGQF